MRWKSILVCWNEITNLRFFLGFIPGGGGGDGGSPLFKPNSDGPPQRVWFFLVVLVRNGCGFKMILV